MRAIKYMKDPSVKVNTNWGHNKPTISQKPGEYGYMSPLIRELCVRCKDLNVQLMNLLNDMSDDDLKKTTLAELNVHYPEILQRVIYNREIYNNIINNLPKLCEHNKRDGKCTVEGCDFNPPIDA